MNQVVAVPSNDERVRTVSLPTPAPAEHRKPNGYSMPFGSGMTNTDAYNKMPSVEFARHRAVAGSAAAPLSPW